MGGYGSSRWAYHSKAIPVEDCSWIDASRWMREGILKPGVWKRGSWQWLDSQTGDVIASIGYEVNTANSQLSCVRLFYRLSSGGEQIDSQICLTTTEPHFGGIRYWFECPLSVDGSRCGRRVSKLYLPPREHYYGCRACHELTYESCQQSHRFSKTLESIRKGMEKDDLMARRRFAERWKRRC